MYLLRPGQILLRPTALNALVSALPNFQLDRRIDILGMASAYRPSHYHRLANIMAKDKDLAIFQRFGNLSALRLLSLQAEIVDLQTQYQYQCKLNDTSTDASRRRYSQSFRQLRSSRQADDEQPPGQFELLEQLDDRLDRYYRLLIQSSQVATIRQPDKHQLRQLQDWLRDKKGGDNFLLEDEIETWLDSDPSAYVCPSPSSLENDIFTSWLSTAGLRVYHFLFGRQAKKRHVIDEESELVTYKDSAVDRAAGIITVIASSLIPVLTIYVLSLLQTLEARIGVTAALTGTFAMVLATFSDSRRIEIFAATATFAAVEVVYIGSALNNKVD